MERKRRKGEKDARVMPWNETQEAKEECLMVCVQPVHRFQI